MTRLQRCHPQAHQSQSQTAAVPTLCTNTKTCVQRMIIILLRILLLFGNYSHSNFRSNINSLLHPYTYTEDKVFCVSHLFCRSAFFPESSSPFSCRYSLISPTFHDEEFFLRKVDSHNELDFFRRSSADDWADMVQSVHRQQPTRKKRPGERPKYRFLLSYFTSWINANAMR